MKKISGKIISVILCISFLLGAAVCMPVTTSAITKNEAVTAEFLTKQMGLNTAAACGILANIYWESGFNPNCVGDNGTSYGICQWHNSRWDRMKEFCTKKGYDWKTLNGQLWYLKYELEEVYPTILTYVKSVANNATGAYNAGYYWCYNFERPADKENLSVKRGNLAKNTYWVIYSVGYSTVNPGVYRFKNRSTGTYLAVKGAVDANGQNIELSSSAGNAAVFILGHVYGTVYNLKADCSKAGRMVNVYADTVASGKNVTLYDKTDDASQQWFFQKVTNGYVIRCAAEPTCVLTVSGTNVNVTTYTGASAQVWEMINISTYTVKYDANGGTGAPAAQSKKHDAAITLSKTKPTLPGYIFKGWAESADAETAKYAPGASFSYNGDITLYAVWQIEPCEGEGGTGHKWNFVEVTKAPDCEEDGKGNYYCSKCKNTVEMTLADEDMFTEWTDSPIPEYPEAALETKTQYRYTDGTTEDGLAESASGTVLTAEFPKGFDTENELYKEYNNPVTDTETRKFSEDKTAIGYILWHWCCSSYKNTTPGNLYINTEKTVGDRAYDVFHAFFTEKYYEYDPVKDGTKVEHPETCKATYWWQEPITVYSCGYTDYKPLKLAVFSDWQDDPVPEGEGITVETRTVYRYDLHALGHDYTGEQVLPTCTEEGYTAHTCTRCSDSYNDSTTAALGHDMAISEMITPVTCTENASVKYTCTRCPENSIVPEEEMMQWSEWTQLYFENVNKAFVETKVQYRATPEDEWTDTEPEAAAETRTLYRYLLIAPGHAHEKGLCPVCGDRDYSFIMPGDANFDLKVNAVDSNIMRVYILDGGYTDKELFACDLNSDKKLNAVDSNLLKAIILGEAG